MSKLASATRSLDHRCLRRASIHDECAAECRGNVGRREAKEVGVLVKYLPMASRVGPRGRGTLRDDHQEARTRDRKQRRDLSPTHFRKANNRQTATDSLDYGDAVTREVE